MTLYQSALPPLSMKKNVVSIISGHRESESEKETRSFHPRWPPQPPEINMKIVCHIWSVLSTTFAWSLSPVIVKVKVEKETDI